MGFLEDFNSTFNPRKFGSVSRAIIDSVADEIDSETASEAEINSRVTNHPEMIELQRLMDRYYDDFLRLDGEEKRQAQRAIAATQNEINSLRDRVAKKVAEEAKKKAAEESGGKKRGWRLW